jgi:methylmalonyl-CoA mutase C-terminal domain/subunit
MDHFVDERGGKRISWFSHRQRGVFYDADWNIPLVNSTIFFYNSSRSYEGREDMTNIMVRILLAKLGDGYDQAQLQLGKALLGAGFEVIYTNTQDPDSIVASALQESVDHVGITILPGADIWDIKRIMEQLSTADAPDIQVAAGGFLDEKDIPMVKDFGVAEFFPKGTTFDQLVKWAKEHITPVVT